MSDLTIGELAARSGVATSALRFWEQQGLIVAERTEGNQRRYARATLRRVALIQAGSAAGVPLRRIGEALATLPHDRTPTKRDWSRLSQVWRDDLDRKIAELERAARRPGRLHRLRLPVAALVPAVQPRRPARRAKGPEPRKLLP